MVKLGYSPRQKKHSGQVMGQGYNYRSRLQLQVWVMGPGYSYGSKLGFQYWVACLDGTQVTSKILDTSYT